MIFYCMYGRRCNASHCYHVAERGTPGHSAWLDYRCSVCSCHTQPLRPVSCTKPIMSTKSERRIYMQISLAYTVSWSRRRCWASTSSPTGLPSPPPTGVSAYTAGLLCRHCWAFIYLHRRSPQLLTRLVFSSPLIDYFVPISITFIVTEGNIKKLSHHYFILFI